MTGFAKTIRVRVRDKHVPLLRQLACAVNLCWNYCNELSSRCIRERGLFLSTFDLHPYMKGAQKELGLHSQTLQCVAKEYVTRRQQFRRSRLAWRKSKGVRRSLGWIPINTGAACWKNGQVYHNGHFFSVWDSYGLSQYRFRTASFTEDARGRWYFNVVVETKPVPPKGTTAIGLDLGLKDIATPSQGDKLQAGHWFRDCEQALASAQRALKKKRVQAIHAKITNRRKDALHKFSRKLVNSHAAIFVGNVKPRALIGTRLSKSVHDAGWGMLKTMLAYKCEHAGVVFEEIDEAYTTQTCSSCGALPGSRPTGIAGLGIREWECSVCGVRHDRDRNAAQNILAAGHRRLVAGIPLARTSVVAPTVKALGKGAKSPLL